MESSWTGACFGTFPMDIDDPIPLVRSASRPLPLVRVATHDRRPRVPEPSVVVDPALYREAEALLRGDEILRVAHKLRALIGLPGQPEA